MSQNETLLKAPNLQILIVFLLSIFTLNAFSKESYLSVRYSEERSPASINRAVSAIATPSQVFYGHDGDAISPELIATFNKLKKEETKVDLSKFIPLDMAPCKSSQTVAIRMADQTMQTMFNSVEFRQSPLGSTTVAVQESLKTEVNLQRPEGNQQVDHKLQMSLQAFQRYAQIKYSGIGSAALKYFVDSSKVAMEVSEKLSKNQSLVLTHSQAPTGKYSQVSVLFEF